MKAWEGKVQYTETKLAEDLAKGSSHFSLRPNSFARTSIESTRWRSAGIAKHCPGPSLVSSSAVAVSDLTSLEEM